MASKPPNLSPEYTGTQVLATALPTLSLDSVLLGSAIPLPPHTRIWYRSFTPCNLDRVQGARDIDQARQSTLGDKSEDLVVSILHSTHVSGAGVAELHAFAFGSAGMPSDSVEKLRSLEFDLLVRSELRCFAPDQVFPCSDACSFLHDPCPRCQDSAPGNLGTPTASTPLPGVEAHRSAACLLPRLPLRTVLVRLLDAVRIRLVDNIAARAASDPSRTPVRRLQDGFLIGPTPRSSEWASRWHKQTNFSLLHCQLEVQLTSTRLIIQPKVRPTAYIPLNLPTPQGTPVTLLPYATPAYYLSTYSGPTSSLTQQFTSALQGLGVGAWARPDARYIIAWIGVQNTHGEAKGTTVVWPASLCVGLHPASSAASARAPLAHVPELPTQLQFSPPPASAPVSPGARMGRTALNVGRRPPFQRTVTAPAETHRTLRSLALTRAKPVRGVATDVGHYVDAVIRDRERERERARRERELGPTSKPSKLSVRTTPLTPPTGSTKSLTVPVASLSPREAAFSEPTATEDKPIETAPPVPAPVSDTHPPVPPDPAPPPAPAEDTKTGPPGSFDAFDGFNGAWATNGNEFLDVNMDYNLGFGTSTGTDSMGGSSGASTGMSFGAVDRDNGMDLDFDVFTADDFNFFDDPVQPTLQVVTNVGRPISAPILTTASLDLALPMSGLTPTAGPAPFGLSPSAFATISPHVPQQSPWLASAFSPSLLKFENTLPGPALPTPQSTPSNGPSSVPPTPSVRLIPPQGWPVTPSTPQTPFDTIPFAPAHRLADGKYAIGKFALPSPPDDPVRTPSPSLSVSPFSGRPLSAPSAPPSWMARYRAATDPRISVVRKLIGFKRKSSGISKGVQTNQTFTLWGSDHDDWTDAVPPSSDISEDEDLSAGETDDGEDTDMGEPDVPRPSTPPPPWLPHGPSLLSTHFHHSLLLPLSAPLRMTTATTIAPATLAVGVPPVSVPTPVSPAAITGPALEKARSLEAAAQVLVREVVDNVVWADAWMAVMRPEGETFGENKCLDVEAIGDSLSAAEIGTPLTIHEALSEQETFISTDTAGGVQTNMCLLTPPALTVGKSDAIIRVLPSALRFWDKLGLAPRAGRKDVEAYVLFEDTGEECRAELQAWLNSVSAAYSAKNYGRHNPGTCQSCVLPGLVPMKLDSFRKEFASFVQNLPRPTAYAVLYVVVPDNVSSLAYQAFRQVLSLVKRAHRLEGGALFHLVPEALIHGCGPDRAPASESLDALTRSLYDRLYEPIERAAAARVLQGSGATLVRRFQGPSFAVARPNKAKIGFTHDPLVRGVDPAEHYTLLHVGYAFSNCGRWVAAACVDQRGEAHDVQVWLNPVLGEAPGVAEVQLQVVGLVWGFAREFARRAKVEWRVVIAKLGTLGEVEVDAWMSHLTSALPVARDVAPMHVFVISAQQDSAWTLATSHTAATISSSSNLASSVKATSNISGIAHGRTSSKDVHKTVMADTSAATYFVSSRTSQVQQVGRPNDIGYGASFISEDPTECTSTMEHSTYDVGGISLRARAAGSLVVLPPHADHAAVSALNLRLLHSASTFGIHPPSEVQTLEDTARSFHDLMVLTKERWRGSNAGQRATLPFHLAALTLMLDALRGADESSLQE